MPNSFTFNKCPLVIESILYVSWKDGRDEREAMKDLLLHFVNTYGFISVDGREAEIVLDLY